MELLIDVCVDLPEGEEGEEEGFNGEHLDRKRDCRRKAQECRFILK